MKRSLLWCAAFALALSGCHKKQEDAAAAKGGNSSSAAAGEKGDKGDRPSVPADMVKIARDNQPKAGIQVAPVSVQEVAQTMNITGQVTMDEKRTHHIGALAEGRIDAVYVVPGDHVRRGQTLGTLHSHTVHETVAALTQAYADLKRQQSAVVFATQTRDRYTRLFNIQAASLEEKQKADQELAQAAKNLADAEANVRAEREHLAELLQVRPETLQPGTLYNRELVPIRAVSDGVVISRAITTGQVVNTGDECFVVSDLSTVWVSGAASERDLAQLRLGARAAVTIDGSNRTPIFGTVTSIGDVVDPETRTLPVRVSAANPGERLRPNMFVNVAVDEPSPRLALFVSEDALQDVNGFQVVFVTADGETFQARAVKTGAHIGGNVEIVEGLQRTNRVVVKGAFMVKGELLKGTVGEG